MCVLTFFHFLVAYLDYILFCLLILTIIADLGHIPVQYIYYILFDSYIYVYSRISIFMNSYNSFATAHGRSRIVQL